MAIEDAFHWEAKLSRETRNDVLSVIFTILSAQSREEIVAIEDRLSSLFRHSDLCHQLFYNYDLTSITRLLECFASEIIDHAEHPIIKNYQKIRDAEKRCLLNESLGDIVKFRLLEYIVHIVHRVSPDASYHLSNEFALAVNQKCVTYGELSSGVIADLPCSPTYYPVDKYLILKEKHDAWLEKLKSVT